MIVCIYCWQDFKNCRELLINYAYLIVSIFLKVFVLRSGEYSRILWSVIVFSPFVRSCSYSSCVSIYCEIEMQLFNVCVQTVVFFLQIDFMGGLEVSRFWKKTQIHLLLIIGVWDKHYFCHYDLTIVEPNRSYVRPHSSLCIFPFLSTNCYIRFPYFCMLLRCTKHSEGGRVGRYDHLVFILCLLILLVLERNIFFKKTFNNVLRGPDVHLARQGVHCYESFCWGGNEHANQSWAEIWYVFKASVRLKFSFETKIVNLRLQLFICLRTLMYQSLYLLKYVAFLFVFLCEKIFIDLESVP